MNVLTILAKRAGIFKKIPVLPILVDEQVKLYTFIFHPKRFMKMKELCRRVTKEFNLGTSYHRFGGMEFRWQDNEIAHMHGNGLLDIHYPIEVRKTLVTKGFTNLHHVYPESGWTSFQIKSNTQVDRCVKLIDWSLQLHKRELTSEGLLEIVEHEILNI